MYVAGVPKPAAKVFLGVHVRKSVRDELSRLAALNERTLAGELRVALAKHLRDERAKAKVAA